LTQFDYTGISATASKLLNRFGSAVTVKHKVVGAHDPIAGTVSNTITETVLNGVVTRIDKNNFPEAMIVEGDLLIYLDGSCEVADVITVNSIDYQVISTQPIRPATDLILTKAQIRK